MTSPASICERVFATTTGGLYIPGIRPALAADRGNVRTAAGRLIWILHARARHEQPAAIWPSLGDLTALQRALARHGHHGEVIIPPPFSAPATRPRWVITGDPHPPAGIPLGRAGIGDRTHIPATAQTIAWALQAGPAAAGHSPPPRDVTP